MALGDVVESSLKMSFRFGRDFDDDMGVTGGDRNNPPVEAGDDERNNDELDDDDGRLLPWGEPSGIVNFDNDSNGDVIGKLSSFVALSINGLCRRW
jgi:hypothetical protein